MVSESSAGEYNASKENSIKESLNMDLVFDLANVHLGLKPLTLEYFEQHTMDIAMDFSRRASIGFSSCIYTIPVGSSMGVWRLRELFNSPTHNIDDTPFSDDVDVITLIDLSDEDDPDELYEHIIRVEDEMRNEGVKFCVQNSPSQNILFTDDFKFKPSNIGRIDYSDLENIRSIFEEIYRDVVRFDQLFGIPNLMANFNRFVNSELIKLTEKNFGLEGEISEMSKSLFENPPRMLSPVKGKHLLRVKPSLNPNEVRDILDHLQLIGLDTE